MFTQSANADDYGAGHTLATLGVGLVAKEATKIVFPGNAPLQKLLTGVATGYTAYRFCKRESDARGGAPFNEWDELYGSADSQMDCAGPVGVAAYFVLVDAKW